MEFWINVYSGVYANGELHYSNRYKSRQLANLYGQWMPTAKLIYRIHVRSKGGVLKI